MGWCFTWGGKKSLAPSHVLLQFPDAFGGSHVAWADDIFAQKILIIIFFPHLGRQLDQPQLKQFLTFSHEPMHQL